MWCKLEVATLCYDLFIHFSCTLCWNSGNCQCRNISGISLFQAFTQIAECPGGYSTFQITEVMKGFLWVSNFCLHDFLGRKIFVFFGWLDLRRNVLGIQNNLKIRGGVCISWPCSSAIKVQPKLFCFLWTFKAGKFGMGFFWSLIFGSGIFGGFVESPHSIIPSHLKSRLPPLGRSAGKKTENWKRLERIANVSSPFFSVCLVLGFHYFWSALHYLSAAWNNLF